MNDKATPRPWREMDGEIICHKGVLGACWTKGEKFSGNEIDTAEQNANAALIVQAVNTHHELMSALSELLNYVGDGSLLMKDPFPKHRNGRLDEDEANANAEWNEQIRLAVEAARAALAKLETQ